MCWCFIVSCSNSVKNTSSANETELDTLPAKKVSDRFRNKLRGKALEEYLQNSPAIQLTKKYKAPFDKLEFDKVIAYDYDGDEEAFPSIISRTGNFIPIIDKQIALTEKQTDYLIDNILTANSTYGGSTAACFQPHMGIIFFKDSERVMVIDICLGCNFLETDKDIPATRFHNHKIEEHIIPDNGFSKNGKKRIRNLATELDFYYSNKNEIH